MALHENLWAKMGSRFYIHKGRAQYRLLDAPVRIWDVPADVTLVVSSGSEAGSYLRLTDSCITQIKAQGPSRTCNESKEVSGADGAAFIYI